MLSLKQLINVKKIRLIFSPIFLGVKCPIDFGLRCTYGHLAPLTGCFTWPKGSDNVYIKIYCIVVLVIGNRYTLRKKQPPEVILDNI